MANDADVAKQLRNLVKVFAYAQIKEEAKTERKARFLKSFGLSEQEIADLLGVSQPAVNQALSKDKKKAKADDTASNPKEGS